MRTSFFITLALATFAASIGQASIKCVPETSQPWPNNAEVVIKKVNNKVVMTVSTEYYGVSLDDQYVVETNGLSFKGQNKDQNASLTITDVNKKTAVLDSEKDGVQNLICDKTSL